MSASTDLIEIDQGIDRLESALRFRTDVNAQAPVDLAQLGIDRPDFRWGHATRHIHELHEAALLAIRADLIEIMMCLHIDFEWSKAGPGGFAPDRTYAADAIGWAERTFSPQAWKEPAA